MEICNYELCKSKATQKECQYCRKIFCKRHLNPTIPSLPDDTEDFLIEERYKSHHPCEQFFRESMRKKV